MITKRLVIVLMLAAILSLAAAVSAYMGNHRWRAQDLAGEAMLPGLAAKLNSIAQVEIRDKAGSLNLQREGSGWRLQNEDGYPADPARVNALLIGLAELERLEAKTDRPERYSALGLDAPDKPEGQGGGTLVTLQGQDGSALGSLIIGKLRAERLGDAVGISGTYVRAPDDAQSWLVSGDLRAASELSRWVDTRMLGLTRDQIARATVTPAGQPPLTLSRVRGGDGQQSFTIENLPADLTLKSPSGAMLAATDFAGLSFEAVRKMPAQPGVPASTVELTTTQGMVLRLLLTREGQANWVSIAQLAPGSNQEAAAALKKRIEGWQFRLSETAARPFFVTLAALTEKKEAPAGQPNGGSPAAPMGDQEAPDEDQTPGQPEAE